jgi:uncharacterized membrane protein (GlpM family)
MVANLSSGSSSRLSLAASQRFATVSQSAHNFSLQGAFRVKVFLRADFLFSRFLGASRVLLLKLLLVPAFLLLVSLAGKRWGPSVAGWLAGLPTVAGPILFFLAIERGETFASNAAAASLSAVFASVAFSVAYAHAAQRLSWWSALLFGLSAWGAAAASLSWLPASIWLSLLVAIFSLIAAPYLFPIKRAAPTTHLVAPTELFSRMFAGAVLTIAVTGAASALGEGWSGLLAVFPVLGIVLAVFSHRTQGPAFVAALLRAMATGLYSFSAFCFAL